MIFAFNPLTRSFDLVGAASKENKKVKELEKRVSVLERESHTHPVQYEEPDDKRPNSIWFQTEREDEGYFHLGGDYGLTAFYYLKIKSPQNSGTYETAKITIPAEEFNKIKQKTNLIIFPPTGNIEEETNRYYRFFFNDISGWKILKSKAENIKISFGFGVSATLDDFTAYCGNEETVRGGYMFRPIYEENVLKITNSRIDLMNNDGELFPAGTDFYPFDK